MVQIHVPLIRRLSVSLGELIMAFRRLFADFAQIFAHFSEIFRRLSQTFTDPCAGSEKICAYEGLSKKKVVSVRFGTLARAQPAELTARFSKYDFWNLGEIWDRNT